TEDGATGFDEFAGFHLNRRETLLAQSGAVITRSSLKDDMPAIRTKAIPGKEFNGLVLWDLDDCFKLLPNPVETFLIKCRRTKGHGGFIEYGEACVEVVELGPDQLQGNNGKVESLLNAHDGVRLCSEAMAQKKKLL